MTISLDNVEGMAKSRPLLCGRFRRWIAVYMLEHTSKNSFGGKFFHRQDSSIADCNCLVNSSVVYSWPGSIMSLLQSAFLWFDVDEAGMGRARISAKHRSIAYMPRLARICVLPFDRFTSASLIFPISASKETPPPALNMVSPVNRNSGAGWSVALQDSLTCNRKTTLPRV